MCRRGSAEGNDNDNIMGIVKNYDIWHDRYTILIITGADRCVILGVGGAAEVGNDYDTLSRHNGKPVASCGQIVLLFTVYNEY